MRIKFKLPAPQRDGNASILPVVLLQVSNFSSGISNAIVMIAIPWLTLEVTGSPAFAGLVVALSSISALVIAPFGGILIAKFSAKAVSIFSDLMSAFSVLLFPLLALTNNLSATSLLLVAIFGAIFDPSGYTARKTMIQPAAEKSNFETDRINGIHEGLFGSSWIIGPALGAWLIAVFGAANAFWSVFVLFLVSAAVMVPVKVPSSIANLESSSSAFGNLSDLSLGFRRIWNDKFLRNLFISILIIAAIYLPTESIVLPTYFESINKPTNLGIVISALAAGSTATSFAYGWLVKKLSGQTLIRIAFLGSSLGTLGMSFLPRFEFMLGFALLLGISWGPFIPLLNSKIQTRFPLAEHPMLFSAQTSVFYAAPPLGMLLVGFSVENFGISQTYFSLAISMTVVSVFALLSKSIRIES